MSIEDDSIRLLNEIYKFEENSKLYSFRLKDTNLSMWMLMRGMFISSITDDKESQGTNTSNYNYTNRTPIKKNLLCKFFTRNPFFLGKKDILFACWGYNLLKQNSNNLAYYDLIMPYLRMYPQKTSLIMTGDVYNEYELTPAFPNWGMDDIFWSILRLRTFKKRLLNNIKIIKKNKENAQIKGIKDKENIDAFLTFLTRTLPIPFDDKLIKSAKEKLDWYSIASNDIIAIYKHYLNIVKPKIVIICCASYPTIITTSLIIACRNQGIPTAELQHGFVGKYHCYYHYSNFVLNNSECNIGLPDFFLTFGEYWNGRLSIPQKCFTLGYAKPFSKSIPTNNKILFCAGLNYDLYENFLDKILPHLEDTSKIYFRFHPLALTENLKKRFEKYNKYPNFSIANDNSLSYYMKKCRYVIEDGSTTAFEALFMGRIVFSFVTPNSALTEVNHLPSVHLINNPNDFLNLWIKRNELKPKVHDDIFCLNYKRNYVKFLKEVGINTDKD